MRANQLLKHNIDLLLRTRGQHRKDLAQWCYRTESWISKIFRSNSREIPLKYLDRIADFFGLATYQLFQPGISPLTERRRQMDRRKATDRRIGHVKREMQTVAADIDMLRPRSTKAQQVEQEIQAARLHAEKTRRRDRPAIKH